MGIKANGWHLEPLQYSFSTIELLWAKSLDVDEQKLKDTYT